MYSSKVQLCLVLIIPLTLWLFFLLKNIIYKQTPAPTTPHTQPPEGLISERISCIAFRFPPLTTPLLPNERTHSSVLVVWGYLGGGASPA